MKLSCCQRGIKAVYMYICVQRLTEEKSVYFFKIKAYSLVL